MLLKKLKEESTKNEDMSKESSLQLEGVTTTGVDFSVATMPVSMHLPLSRFLAGLSLSLEMFSKTWRPENFKLTDQEMPDLALVLELPLRTMVMVSQVAEM